MAKTRFLVEQIIGHLREAEVLLSQGMTVGGSAAGSGSRSRVTTAGAGSTEV